MKFRLLGSTNERISFASSIEIVIVGVGVAGQQEKRACFTPIKKHYR
jgi:hypothetical protein